MKKLIFLLTAVISSAASLFGQSNVGISGTVNWESMRLNSEITLDLVSSGIRLPAGRTQGESLLSASYLYLISPSLLEIRVDSSSTIADLIERGELNLTQTEAIALGADKTPSSLSPDMRSMVSSCSISLENISSALLSRNAPVPVSRVMSPVSAARYTGIIIIAAESLPIHGMRGVALAVPCIFPKIWDSEMNLIYEKSMLEPRNIPMARYSSYQNIFQDSPSGLSAELRKVAGDRPLRIFARGVFGINPTDLIIDREDALIILSSDENRGLLSQGKVAIILNESVLKKSF